MLLTENSMNPTNGKGSRQRPTDKAKFDSNYDRIFGSTKQQANQVKQQAIESLYSKGNK